MINVNSTEPAPAKHIVTVGVDCEDSNTSGQTGFVLIDATFWVVALSGPRFIASEIKCESGLGITVHQQMTKDDGHSDQPLLVIVTGPSNRDSLISAIRY